MRLDEPSREALVEGEILTTLSVASRLRSRVRLRYTSAEGETSRLFDPYAVIFYQERWYTVGYCHLRDGLRVFRLDRMQEAAIVNARFSPLENFDAFNYMLNSFEAIPDEWNVDVLLDTSVEMARRNIPRELATLVQEGGRVRLRASIRDLDDMARTIVRLGCPFTVLHPPELRDAFCRVAAEITRCAAC
jgi:predicted DNA-binding transcriptional regulator YafY